jgi:hypothetical protein
MSELRAALFLYDDSEVTIEPEGPTDLYEMSHQDYSAKFLETLTGPITRTFPPGAYGVFYIEKHGIEPPDGSRLVTGVAKKTPWPAPPPPPPPPWADRTDWDAHRKLFMVPLGGELPAEDDPGA